MTKKWIKSWPFSKDGMSCYSVKIFWNNLVMLPKFGWKIPLDIPRLLWTVLASVLHLAIHCPSAQWKQDGLRWRSDARDRAERFTLSHIRPVCPHLSAHTGSKQLEIPSIRRGGVPNEVSEGGREGRKGGRVGVGGAKAALQVPGLSGALRLLHLWLNVVMSHNAHPSRPHMFIFLWTLEILHHCACRESSQGV